MSRKLSKVMIALVVCVAISTSPAAAAETVIRYPETRRTDECDVYHGMRVPDPYRWLEQDVRTAPEVQDWVARQNEITFGYLAAIPQRAGIHKRLTELWNYTRYTTPERVGGKYYFRKNDGLQNQAVLYVADSLSAEPRVVLDPNTWSKDGTVALAQTYFTNDGGYLAYSVAESGSDWHTFRILDLPNGRLLPDEVRWTKHSRAAWTADSKGFFYSRYDEPKKGQDYQAANFNQRVFYHRLGTRQSEDVLAYHRPDQPRWAYSPLVTDDGRYLVITIRENTSPRYRIAFRDLSEPYGLPIDLISEFTNEYTFIGNDGPQFYFQTDLHAPRGRVIAIDIRRPSPAQWKEIVPHSRDTLTNVQLVGDYFVAEYLHDAHSRVRIFNLKGDSIRDVVLPGIGTASGFSGKRKDRETFYTFASFATPPSIYHYDLIGGQSTLFRRAEVRFQPDNFEVKQVFYASKDGTRVPMFICHKRGLVLDGNQPTLLFGYGGFNIPLTPAFSIPRIAWMEMGGVLAVANLRGGGEYGAEWHRAGTKERKQNVFDDFIAAAEWLIKQRYTRPGRLAIQGGSNGGLLVGAAMTQRPELFGVCLPAVGVMDMLRFHKFTVGRFWTDDYGSAENPKEFRALLSYSPYHNLKQGTAYPATLVTTADTDDRVVPGHSFKFAAALQHAHTGRQPVLIRIETKAGHSATGKPTAKLIDEAADVLAFLVANLGMKTP